MTFRPKPTRPSASALAEALAPAARPLPPTRGEREGATVQIMFRCSPTMASIVGRRAEEAGSTHRLFARLLADAGEPIPEYDLEPPKTGRRTR